MNFNLGADSIKKAIDGRTTSFTHLEDFVDRLNHFFTCSILCVLAGVTMANVYFLRPIACTLPTAPDNKFNEFSESYCWVRGTIGIREADDMPVDSKGWEKFRERSDISFYQWVPFCLSVQAILFFVPHIIWQSLARYTMGENLDSILDRTRKITDKQEGESRQLGIRSIACQMFRLFQQHQDTRHSLWSRFQRRVVKVPGGALLAVGKRMGNYFPIAYVLVKALYLTNAIGQLQIIRQFLGFQGRLVDFGASLFNTLRQKREWNEDETFFPRQTYCPVPIRHLGNKNNVFTAICALPVNMFNEKIYIFLWFWISMVAMATGLSLLLWLARFMFQACQRDFVRDYLMLSIQTFLNDPTAFRESLKEEERHNKACSACNVGGDDKRLKKFVAKFLRSDGAFLLRMMRSNAGDVVTGEILTELWHLYVEVHDKPTQDGESKHLNNSKPEAIPLLKSDAKRSERNGDPTRLA